MRIPSILLFLILTLKLSAQYLPIIDEKETSWLVKHEVWDRAEIDTLYISDTITIDSKQYNKIILNNYDSYTVAGYFREDSTSGKAWFLGVKDSIEYLIMNMNLQMNDSFLVKIHEKKYAHVLSIDTIDGRKTIELDYEYGGGFIDENIKFIEGVGPNATLMYQIDWDTAMEIRQKFGFLVCKMYKDNDITYAWDTINYDCGVLWSGVDDKENQGVLIFPNPANKTLNITSKENITINLFNSHGSLVKKTKDKVIDLTNFSNGIYIIEIKVDKKIIANQKIIINNAW